MLTEEEKWLFDLHGFLHLKNVIPPEDIARMVELCDRWHALPDEQLPPPLSSYKDASTKPTTARAIVHPEYADEVFQRAVLNREILRVVIELTSHCPKSLLVGLTRNTKDCEDIPFHGGFSGGLRNPANDYQAADGKVFATFLAAAVALVDVPRGSGFVCIPGSHKSEFNKPDDVNIYDGPPTVFNVCPSAGDVVIFTELLCHGGRKWKEDDPRRSLFMRYSTAYASWSPDAGPIEEHRDRISDELCELKQNASFRARKKVVRRVLEELGEG